MSCKHTLKQNIAHETSIEDNTTPKIEETLGNTREQGQEQGTGVSD